MNGAVQAAAGEVLWHPSSDTIAGANITRFADFATRRTGRPLPDYRALWDWSVTDIEAFWQTLWDFYDVRAASPPLSVLENRSMPGARWFPGAELSYAEHVFRMASPDRPAIVAAAEDGSRREVSWEELRSTAAAVAAHLRRSGVGRGDRVVSYMPNVPETIAAFLGAASVGAIWSSVSPDFGTRSVVDRFRQVEPRVMFAVDGYRYGGIAHDRRQAVGEIRAALPGLEQIVSLGMLDPGWVHPDGSPWQEVAGDRDADLDPIPLPFDHPLWVVYTSGTTGLPKPIVHGQGGVLLEHLKLAGLHFDLGAGDRFFWYSSTGWIMWNLMVGTLLTGATIVPYDGSVGHPDLEALWRLVSETGITFFGLSAAYVLACMKEGIEPGKDHDLSSVVAVGSTGSPLPPEGFAWLYEQFGPELWLTSASGGTDVATAFVGGAPTLPVRAGELQARCLGAKVEAYDAGGRSVVDEVGELVVSEPMPSMPLYLWGDDGSRLHDSYFAMYPGVWRHGDWIRITPEGSAVITGRSDSTINRRGIRMGTSELYSVVEDHPAVQDSLVVDVGRDANDSRMLLFVVLGPGSELDGDLEAELLAQVRRELSPRHVPDEIHVIDEVPRTLNGKKLEVPIKRLLQGVPLVEALNVDAMANPRAVEAFVALARVRAGEEK